jgi:hypothetical protein
VLQVLASTEERSASMFKAKELRLLETAGITVYN